MKNDLLSECAYLDSLIRKISKSLEKKPEGILNACYKRNSYQYFLKADSQEKHGSFIRKEDIHIAKALAQRDYDEKMLACALTMRKKLENMIGKDIFIDSRRFYKDLSDVYTSMNAARQALVVPYVQPDEMYIKSWLEEVYQGKGFVEGFPEYYTERGERVRSKSEKMIADKLFLMNIPYRYEFPVKLRGMGLVYPDFTLLNISSRKTIIYEHFGRMQEEDYCVNALSKIETYERNGYRLGKDFICTFESKDHPLDMRCAVNVIKSVLD